MMKRRKASLCAVAVLAAGALPSGATAKVRDLEVGHASPWAAQFSESGPAAVAQSATSSARYAGYTGSPAAGATSATATLRVPKVKCLAGRTGTVDEAYGIEIHDPSDQYFAGGGLGVTCNGTTPDYELSVGTFIDFEGQSTPAAPGDLIRVIETDNADDLAVTATDVTTNTTVSADDYGPAASPGTTFNVGLTDVLGYVAPSTPTAFSDVTVDGQPLGDLSPTAQNNRPGHKIAEHPGPISGTPPESFALTFEHVK